MPKAQAQPKTDIQKKSSVKRMGGQVFGNLGRYETNVQHKRKKLITLRLMEKVDLYQLSSRPNFYWSK